MSKPLKDLPTDRQGKNIQIPADVLKNLLTPSEWRMLKNRFQIMSLLAMGLPIRKVAQKVNVGTDTVVRVSRMIQRHQKIRKIKSQTPWIFGKSNE